ncbi:MAG: extracellular solute-binding protein [Candidatus Uhrbacteria bacterium]|nr:extracellular solute-binding protein [Candidatus Uhrbacteria bacterium]
MRLNRLFISLTLFGVLLTTGAGCSSGGSSSSSSKSVELTVWRVFDEDDSFDTIISGYRLLHPNVKVTYRKLRFDEYKEELIRAIAVGDGPDILSVHNTWMNEFKDLLEPMPETVSVSYQETRGTLRKQTVMVAREEATMSLKSFKTKFVPVVVDDAIMSYQPDPKIDPTDKIYGLPLAVDTLALFSNQNILNAAGVAEPPSTWEAFQEAVKAITTIATDGTITQSAAAIGTSENVQRSPDLLSVLMMQNGTNMVDDRGRVAFHTIPAGTEEDFFPSLEAIRFYTDFANPTKEVYTWNDEFPNSFEAFVNGETAMYFGYSYDIPLIRTAAPKLDFTISALPQISVGQQVNYASYWLEGVSKSSENPDYAWNFLTFASDAEHVTSYLEAANKPTSLRSLITTQLNDEDIGIFADQLLTAKTWYRGTDVDAAEAAMEDLIDEMLLGPEKPEDVLSDAASIVSQTYSE